MEVRPEGIHQDRVRRVLLDVFSSRQNAMHNMGSITSEERRYVLTPELTIGAFLFSRLHLRDYLSRSSNYPT